MGNSLQNYALKYTDFIFLIVRKVVTGVFFFFFFFHEKIDVPGSVNCKLKNEMTLILEFFLQKKKKTTTKTTTKAGKMG